MNIQSTFAREISRASLAPKLLFSDRLVDGQFAHGFGYFGELFAGEVDERAIVESRHGRIPAIVGMLLFHMYLIDDGRREVPLVANGTAQLELTDAVVVDGFGFLPGGWALVLF